MTALLEAFAHLSWPQAAVIIAALIVTWLFLGDTKC